MMPRRRWALLPALLLPGFLVTGACGGGGEAPPSRDLILVSVDTLRADRLAFYGGPHATGLDPGTPWSPAWLARQGTVFEYCWAPAGKTVPSLATFWTGVEPLEHGALQDGTPIQFRTFAQSYAAAGFTTLARVANIQLAEAWPRPDGSVLEGLGFHRGFQDYGTRIKEREPLVQRELVARARAPIRQGRPLLVWAHFMAPHQPYEPGAGHDLWSGPDAPAATTELLKELHLHPERLTQRLREQLRAKYDGEVRTASDYVRKLLAGLDRHYREAGRGGLLENAVVVFFSDHGEELADHHAYFMHAKSLYTGGVRVPLVIAGPGWEAGRRDPRPISLGEVMPMLMHATPPSREVFVSAWMDEFYSVRAGRWTLLHSPCRLHPGGPVEPPVKGRFPYPEVALFDRDTDPTEQVDVAAQHPGEVRRLLGELQRWYAGLARYSGPTGAAAGLSPRQLEELGYASAPARTACEPWAPERWRP